MFLLLQHYDADHPKEIDMIHFGSTTNRFGVVRLGLDRRWCNPSPCTTDTGGIVDHDDSCSRPWYRKQAKRLSLKEVRRHLMHY